MRACVQPFIFPAQGCRAEKEVMMKFSDLFIPRWRNSNPDVRIKAIEKLDDINLLKQISERDEHAMVRDVAADRIAKLAATTKITE